MYSRSLAFLLVVSGSLALVSALASSRTSFRCCFFSARSSFFFCSSSFSSAVRWRLGEAGAQMGVLADETIPGVLAIAGADGAHAVLAPQPPDVAAQVIKGAL